MIGQRLGSFLIEEKIGAGAMGVVFRALYERPDRPPMHAAVKIITGEAGSKARIPKRFEREAKILEKFRHPHIVRFLARGRYQGVDYVAMEYLTGGTLEDLLDRRGSLSWLEVAKYAVQICDALHYAHDRQIIHRDLKPSNLLFSDSGQIKLTDFGIAKDDNPEAEALTATGRTLGTAAYMAPEQIRGNPPVSHKTDLYALGCLLFQLLTGQTPFRGNSAVVLMHMHLAEPPPRVSSKNPEVPRALDDLILMLMDKDMSKRPFDAEKVRADLAELVEKAERGDKIPMVFAGGPPARLGGPMDGTATVSANSPTISTTTAPVKKPKKAGLATFADWEVPRGRDLGTIGLALALAGGLTFTAFMLWPLSAEELHRRAAERMARDAPSAWHEAERDYISELDRRFPEQFVEEKRAWRDKIALERIRRRAAILEHPSLVLASQPKGPAEERFVLASNEAIGAKKDGRDEDALASWRRMADELDCAGPRRTALGPPGLREGRGPDPGHPRPPRGPGQGPGRRRPPGGAGQGRRGPADPPGRPPPLRRPSRAPRPPQEEGRTPPRAAPRRRRRGQTPGKARFVTIPRIPSPATAFRENGWLTSGPEAVTLGTSPPPSRRRPLTFLVAESSHRIRHRPARGWSWPISASASSAAASSTAISRRSWRAWKIRRPGAS